MSNTLKKFEKRRQRVRTALKKRGKGMLRLSVHRTGQHIYAQLIDDAAQVTLAAASTVEKEVAKKLKSTSNIDAAKVVGKLIAERTLKVSKDAQVYFDRGGYLFHGRVKALADAARENGLKF